MEQQLTGVSELFVVYLLAAALDKNTRKKWEATTPRGELLSYEETVKFLKKQCNCENASHATFSRPYQASAKHPPLQKSNSLKSLVVATTCGGASYQCYFCTEDH